MQCPSLLDGAFVQGPPSSSKFEEPLNKIVAFKQDSSLSLRKLFIHQLIHPSIHPLIALPRPRPRKKPLNSGGHHF
jgi:hypothetical protein